MRDNLIVELRPLINIAIDSKGNVEYFQNNVLRPILKFQNDVIITLFENYIKSTKIDYYLLDKEKKMAYVASVFNKDKVLRNLVLGVIIGLFSLSELDIYFSNKTEINKRIIQMAVQRVVSQI